MAFFLWSYSSTIVVVRSYPRHFGGLERGLCFGVFWFGPALERVVATNKLTAKGAKAKTKPGRYGDGGGLWLQVRG